MRRAGAILIGAGLLALSACADATDPTLEAITGGLAPTAETVADASFRLALAETMSRRCPGLTADPEGPKRLEALSVAAKRAGASEQALINASSEAETRRRLAAYMAEKELAA
ncbi:MAG: hypothetical protein AAFR16_07835, partial [Pseudomonadota bacterium]